MRWHPGLMISRRETCSLLAEFTVDIINVTERGNKVWEISLIVSVSAPSDKWYGNDRRNGVEGTGSNSIWRWKNHK